ncbi:GSCOCG00002544001-RA-CDS [Cotesia congregata]|nr:GSCOCG00002544001-RA-CDS [Cotesia congregata]
MLLFGISGKRLRRRSLALLTDRLAACSGVGQHDDPVARLEHEPPTESLTTVEQSLCGPLFIIRDPFLPPELYRVLLLSPPNKLMSSKI